MSNHEREYFEDTLHELLYSNKEQFKIEYEKQKAFLSEAESFTMVDRKLQIIQHLAKDELLVLPYFILPILTSLSFRCIFTSRREWQCSRRFHGRSFLIAFLRLDFCEIDF